MSRWFTSTLHLLASLTPKLRLLSQKSERLKNQHYRVRNHPKPHHGVLSELITITWQVCLPTRSLLHAGRSGPLSRRSKPGLRSWTEPADRGGRGGGIRLPTDPPGSSSCLFTSRANLCPPVPSANLRSLPLVLRPCRSSKDCDRQPHDHNSATGAKKRSVCKDIFPHIVTSGASGRLQPSDSSSKKASGARAQSGKLGRL